MVVVTLGVNVAVLEFFFARVSNTVDGHVEVKRLTGKRMVRVERDRCVVHVYERHDLLVSVLVLGGELRAHGQFLVRHFILGNLEDELIVSLAVRFGRLDDCVYRVTAALAFERVLESRHNVLVTVQVLEVSIFS
jgi:hypothetical protein